MNERDFLFRAKDIYGRRRFYPPYQHPATARLRAHRDWLEEWHRLHLETPESSEMLRYVRQKLAQFEMGESIAKEHYLRYFEDTQNQMEIASDGS